MATDQTPYLALGLTGAHLLALTDNRELLARWDALPLGFSVLGIDRIDGSAPSPTTIDASAAGAVLAGRGTGARFLIAAAAHRDHPYNLARRVASLGHLSRGRSGVLLGVRDAYAPTAPAPIGAWGGAGLGVGAPLTVATAYDAAKAVRALEQSWPFDSVVGDRATGILVESDRIVHVDLDDTWSIAGPLNAPEPATGPSVVAWYAGAGDTVPVDGDPVDLAVGEHGSVWVREAGAVLPAASSVGAAGLLLRAAPRQPLAEVLDLVETLLGEGYLAVEPGRPLRSALALPPAAPLRAERAAFPVPQPHPSL